MKDGVIYIFAKFIIDKLCLLNLVEYFTKFGLKINPDKGNPDMVDTYKRTAIDTFILLKWLFIIWVWAYGSVNPWIVGITWYLLISNLYTYFFHHIWTDHAMNSNTYDENRIRRRFINLLLALMFSNVCFAYLYRFPYVSHFTWTYEPTSLHSLWFSISNSFAANYSVVSASTGFGNSVAMIQLMITFIFVTIIISRSIPQKN